MDAPVPDFLGLRCWGRLRLRTATVDDWGAALRDARQLARLMRRTETLIGVAAGSALLDDANLAEASWTPSSDASGPPPSHLGVMSLRFSRAAIGALSPFAPEGVALELLARAPRTPEVCAALHELGFALLLVTEAGGLLREAHRRYQTYLEVAQGCRLAWLRSFVFGPSAAKRPLEPSLEGLTWVPRVLRGSGYHDAVGLALLALGTPSSLRGYD